MNLNREAAWEIAKGRLEVKVELDPARCADMAGKPHLRTGGQIQIWFHVGSRTLCTCVMSYSTFCYPRGNSVGTEPSVTCPCGIQNALYSVVGKFTHSRQEFTVLPSLA